MPYTPRQWKDRAVEFPRRFTDDVGNVKTWTPNEGTITEEGTPITAANMNAIEKTIGTLASQADSDGKAIAELLMLADIDSKVFSPNLNKFYTNFSVAMDFSMGSIDTFSKSYSGSLTAGATTITSPSTPTGLSIGMEISIQDSSYYEEKIVTNIVGSVITLSSALTYSYTNPQIYRSNISGSGFGSGVIASTTYDRTTPVSVVNAAYTTSASARPHMLPIGKAIKMVVNGTTDVRFYIDDGTGLNNALLTTWTVNASGGFSITVNGNTVHAICGASTTVLHCKFDVTTVGSTVTTTNNAIDSKTALSGMSIDCNDTGTALTISASVKDATYPNSFNIVSVKSTDGGVTWTKQGGTAGVDQVTSQNTTGNDQINPNVTYMANGKPMIVYEKNYTTSKMIIGGYFTTAWNSNIVYDAGSTYDQSSPSATVQKYGANVGRIEVVWDGSDSVEPAALNIRYSYSDDNGANWQTAVKLTTGNTADQKFSTITTDLNGDVHVQFVGNNTGWRWKRVKKTSGSWGTIVDILGVAIGSSYKPSTCDNYYDFEQPLSIVNTSTDVKFYGKWTVSSTTPLLKNVLRMNIAPYQDVSQISAFLTHGEITGFTASGALSIVDSTANESYVALTKTVTDLGSTNEDAFLGTVTTPNDKVCLKLTMERASTSDAIVLSKLLGGVA